MTISIDGGSLSGYPSERFGTYVFAKNLIHALALYDKRNRYTVYTLSVVHGREKNIEYRALRPRKFWSSVRVSVEEVWNRKDIYFALNQSLPLVTGSKIFSFSHGLSFRLFPDLYPDSYRRMKRQMDTYMDRSGKIIVSSQRVKNELMEHYPRFAEKIVVIPYGVPYDMRAFEEEGREPFFLFVGMDHPIKNIQFLLRAFKKAKEDRRLKDYRLYLFGDFKNIKKDRDIAVVSGKGRSTLRRLYRKATAYIATSLYESFHFPLVEAMSQGCPAIGLQSAVIPELTPFVNTVETLEELVEQMKKVAVVGLQKVSIERLEQLFSWRAYVEKLTSLY